MSKVPLLLFSSGLDSTYMLLDRLYDTDVETLYVAAGQCLEKIKKELAAREKIIAYLNRISPHKIRRDHVVRLDFEMRNPFADYAWTQPLMWLTGALKVSDGYDRHSHLEVGYVSGDSILCRLHDIEKAWEHLQAFTKHHPIPIQFPLKTKQKHQILQALDVKLYKHLWVCEMPVKPKGKRNHVACGECPACHTHAATLFLFERYNGIPYQEFVKPPTPAKEEKS